jgi:hypothetical protein
MITLQHSHKSIIFLPAASCASLVRRMRMRMVMVRAVVREKFLTRFDELDFAAKLLDFLHNVSLA